MSTTVISRHRKKQQALQAQMFIREVSEQTGWSLQSRRIKTKREQTLFPNLRKRWAKNHPRMSCRDHSTACSRTRHRKLSSVTKAKHQEPSKNSWLNQPWRRTRASFNRPRTKCLVTLSLYLYKLSTSIQELLKCRSLARIYQDRFHLMLIRPYRCQLLNSWIKKMSQGLRKYHSTLSK
jgi:hypothetical protein